MAPISKLKSQSVGYYRYYADVVLGKGNFATVYLARHKVVGCEVALKVINTDDIEEEYVYRNLSREARILRDLQHPNIVRLYETVKAVNLYCLSLELIRGVNLYLFMMKQQNRKITERLARMFFHQMLSAVEYMHRLHVIHRDLKLENILVEFGHIIKIADFGLSNIYYPYLELRTHCGSVEYAAPELFKSTAYGTPVDVWSLGVILYAMVVGKMPFMFSREKLECAESSRMRQLFMQRISKGLMQENWELMEGLTPDCWNLLHDLLQPDQYRRIRIEDSLVHHWIVKDESLKERLPQKRKDLRRKFHPEIVEYLAHKLNTSKDRIEKHINAYQNDKIACMFYIVRDILIKDVLHPPTVFETSFLYRFQCWRESRNSLFPIRRYQQNNLKGKEKNMSYFSVKSLSTCLNKIDDECKKSSSKSSNIKDVVDLETQSSTKTKVMKPVTFYSKKSLKNTNQYVPKYINTDDYINTEDNSERNVQENVSRNPYRSYKSSRPENVRSHVSTCSERIKKNFCVNENKERISDLTIDKEIPYSSEKLELVYPFFQQNTPNRKFDNEKKNSPSYTMEKSFTIPNSKRNKQVKSVTYTKNSVDKISSKNEKEICPATILTKCTSLVKDSATAKSNDSVIRKTQTNKRIISNSNLREITSKKLERNCINLLTQSHATSNERKITEGTKVTYAPSRIPIKNMQYGPPAPFSQPVVSSKSKTRKSTEGNRTERCRGDSIEAIQ